MSLRSAKARDDLEFFDQEVDGDPMVVVHDPIRGTYFRFNPLQAAMLRSLDGVRTPAEIASELSEEFSVEVPRAAADRFVARARDLMLLDVACYRVVDERARKQLARVLRRAGFRLRSVARDVQADRRVESAESALFMAAVRHLERGEPIKAAAYLAAVLELNPDNSRARELHSLTEKAFVRGAGRAVDFPTFVLFNPSRVLGWLSRTIGPFLFSRWGVLFMVAYACLGAYRLSEVSFAGLHIGAREIIIVFSLTRLSLFLHEMGHGLACSYYGGRVTEIGVTFYYYVAFAAYCDTSSSYLFDSRRHKVIVQMAGTVVSLLIVATEAILVSVLNPELPVYQGLLLTVIIELGFAGVTLIPFLKNDGYFAICDYYDFPNLRDRSFRVAGAWIKRLLLGLPEETENLPQRTRRWFIAYAVACFLFTTAFLYLGVFRLFAPLVERQGGWALVAALIFSALLVRRFALRPVLATVRLFVRERRAILTPRRMALVLGLAILLVAPWMIRWPILVDSEFVLAPVERALVRAQTPGIVERILVREGTAVQAGQVLAQLRNDDLTASRRALEKELAMADARLARLRNGARSEEIDLARRRLDLAAGEHARSSSDAALKRTLATERLGLGSDADQATRTSRVDAALETAAAAQLHMLRAGALPEEIAAAEAERTRLLAQVQELRAQEGRLTLRSPIAGVVVTPRIEDRLLSGVKSGETVAEVHDVSKFVAELSIPSWAPLGQLDPDSPIALRLRGAPHDEVECSLARVRDLAEGDPAGKDVRRDSELVAVTSAFAMPLARAGMRGRARVYGESRSLAYAHLYLPMKRLFSIRLWSIW